MISFVRTLVVAVEFCLRCISVKQDVLSTAGTMTTVTVRVADEVVMALSSGHSDCSCYTRTCRPTWSLFFKLRFGFPLQLKTEVLLHGGSVRARGFHATVNNSNYCRVFVCSGAWVQTFSAKTLFFLKHGRLPLRAVTGSSPWDLRTRVCVDTHIRVR